MEGKADPITPSFFNSAGSAVSDQAAYQAASVERPEISTATACLELHGTGHGGSVIFDILLIVNPHTYPFQILEGTISRDICNAPFTQWVVTGGSFGPSLFIDARRIPFELEPAAIGPINDNNCAKTMRIIGSFQVPNSYMGTYGTEGSSTDFSHTTLFKGWNTCP
jgi:hypothetical protein